MAGKAVFSPMAWVGRNTIGRGSEKLAESRMLNRLASRPGPLRGIGRWGVRQSQKGASATFDTRATSAGAALSAGKAGVGGFTERKKKTEEETRKAQDRYEVAEAKNAINRGLKEEKAAASAGRPADPAIMKTMTDAIAKMSNSQVEALVTGNKELLDSESFAQTISLRQLEALNKNVELSENDKKTLANSRFADINAAVERVARGGPDFDPAEKKRIQGLADRELDLLNRKHFELEDFVEVIKPSQMEYIMTKSDDFTRVEKNELNNRREMAHSRSVVGIPANITDMDVKDIARLEPRIVNDISVLQHLSAKKLKRLAGEIKDSQANAIRGVITGAPAAPRGTPIGDLQYWLNSDDGIASF